MLRRDTVPEESPGAHPAKRVVLAADDLSGAFAPLVQILAPDCEVRRAATGEETLQACIACTPHVVLLADKLRDRDSIEVLRQLKKSGPDAEIRVIYFTSERSSTAEVQAFAAGADDYMGAPLNPEVLKARVQRQIEMKAKCDALQSFAATDGLTGLANRRRFNEALEQEWKRAARDQIQLSLLMLDVDNFKAFNDFYGHPAGDECLKAISEILKPYARRPGDLVARYGGEEFVVILPGAGETYATEVAKSMLGRIRNRRIPHAANLAGRGVVTASAGFASVLPAQTLTGQATLLSAADQMLYEAKRMGRDRVMSLSALLASPEALIPSDEECRIASVEAFTAVQGNENSAYLDNIARLAATLLETPIGLVSLVGRDNQTFVGKHGLEVSGTLRSESFCAHAINGDSPLVVPDAAADPRFQNNPLVTGDFGLRFYAGAPLTSVDSGTRMGALCVIDRVPRAPLQLEQRTQLAVLAKLATDYIDQITGARECFDETELQKLP